MTLLNSGSLNSTPLNTGASVTAFSETLSDSLIYSTSAKTINMILEAIHLASAESNDHRLLHIVLDALLISKDLSNNSILKNVVNSSINYEELLGLSYNLNLTENTSFTDIISYLAGALLGILDQLSVSVNQLDSIVAKAIISDLLLLKDISDKAISEGILDSVAYLASIDILYKAVSNILENINIETSLSNIVIIPLSSLSSISVEDDNSSISILKEIIDNEFIIQIPSASAQSKYLAYLLSPETNSISTYTNYNFNGCTKFGYKYLFYNKTGLYEHGGTTDNGSPILSEIETVAFNFNTSNLKQVPSIYLGVDSTDKVILKVRVDGKAEVHYQLNKFTNNLMTQKIDIGKGLIGRYFQFELLTEASEFNMESIEFYPLEIRRKL